jgi:hypothetical protein
VKTASGGLGQRARKMKNFPSIFGSPLAPEDCLKSIKIKDNFMNSFECAEGEREKDAAIRRLSDVNQLELCLGHQTID